MMYRGVPGTGTPLITDLDEPPATGPILGYSHQAVANLYTYAQNDPINRVDPSGLESVMTGEGRKRRAVRYAEVVNARITALELTPITLQEAIRDGQLTGAEIARLALTGDEVEAILGTEFLVTLNNFEKAEQDYPNLPPAEAYMRRLAEVNYARAKLRLGLRNTNLRWAIDEFYGLVRGLNPVHFVMEKGYVIGSGEEPVLQRPASQVGAAVELLAYLAMLKGLNYVFGKLRGAALEPLSPTGNTGEIAVIEFSNGGRLEIQKGVKFEPTEVESAFNKAAAGEKVTLKGQAKTEPPEPPPDQTSTNDTPAPQPELDLSKYDTLNIGSGGEPPLGPNVLHVNKNPANLPVDVKGGRLIADATNLDMIPTGHFSAVQANHMEGDPQLALQILKEAFRVLKPGGTGTFSSSSLEPNIKVYMEKAGFTNVKMTGLAKRTTYEGRLTQPALNYVGTKP